MKAKNQTNKCMLTCSVEAEMKQELKEFSNHTGIGMSELQRSAIRKFLDEGCNEGQVMLNLILLTQMVHDTKEKIPQHEYECMQQYLENIMTIKGGNTNGGI